ncbi:MAG TPA: imidazolonepropionase [Thermoleophilia bacterium]|nr:imidazolonepropionase [Thermoleophilia bacterium]
MSDFPGHQADLVVTTEGPLLTCAAEGGGLGLLEGGVVAARAGIIVWVGSKAQAEVEVTLAGDARWVDCGRRVLMPGVVECHSHPVFAGSRAGEFQMRVGGSEYEEIARAGGGIMSTVRETRDASPELLLARGRRHLDWMLDYGITTVEAKSGYGLDTDSELRLLEVIAELGRTHPATVVGTFLGAHAVPLEYRGRADDYVDLVVEEMLPRVAEAKLARFCDVFCEDIAFNLDQSHRVLQAAKEYGLVPKIHADQLSAGGGAQLAAEVEAVSAEHLDYTDGPGIAALAEAGVTAVLLPGAVFFLGRTHYAPARALLEAGVPVAISTDFNPGTCYSENPFLMGTIASCYMGLSASEVILGLTRHAAGALGMEGQVGSLSPGRRADILVLGSEDYLDLPYHFGVNPVAAVFKDGRLVRDRSGGLVSAGKPQTAEGEAGRTV